MKVSANRETLLAAFQTAASFTHQRSPKPILQNVKMIAEGHVATLLATDMEVAVRIDVDEMEVKVPGSALLPVSLFSPILRESTDERLRIEVDDKGVSVFGDRSKFRLPSGNPEEFPSSLNMTADAYHEVSIHLLKELIRRTLFATDTESSRYALGGILMELEADKIVAVGTDGRRLAKMEGPAAAVNGHDLAGATTIVPSKSMQLIDRALADSEEPVRICVQGNDVLLQSGSVTISSRLVEGRFPKWRDVFPKRSESIEIELAVGPLYSAIRQAAIVASSESRGIDFTFGEGSLVLSGITADVGESRVELPIPYDGELITLCLDNRYVSDFLRVLSPERSFNLSIVDADNAAVFATDDGYGYVVMPLAREKRKGAPEAAAVTAEAE
ncbi:MAG: DNA polymerase III subunit beta [Pirellulaceae bacterium]